MIRFSQADSDASTFLYILKDDSERLLYCYMYQAQTPVDVSICITTHNSFKHQKLISIHGQYYHIFLQYLPRTSDMLTRAKTF
ncbi:hypothetical protein WA026_016739 [Henosepilachna vigintioctopunctata]|uniref:Uncharacterized protein n=1 Tax=Henosepilachna vigintioctopunctata TaxID=420089 RepID=A0AAW1V2Z7_9CUCU